MTGDDNKKRKIILIQLIKTMWFQWFMWKTISEQMEGLNLKIYIKKNTHTFAILSTYALDIFKTKPKQ